MTAMTPTELRERLDRLADAHVADLKTSLPVQGGGQTPPHRARLVLVAAAVAVLAGSWFLIRTAGDDGEESPAVQIETLGEPQLNLPAWTELPIVDLDAIDPDVADSLRRGRGPVLDLSTLRRVDTDGFERYVAMSRAHDELVMAFRIPGLEGGVSMVRVPAIGLVNDDLFTWSASSSASHPSTLIVGLVPGHVDVVYFADQPLRAQDGLLSADVGVTSESLRLSLSPDGDPVFGFDSPPILGSFVRGHVEVEGRQVTISLESVTCVLTTDGLWATARRTTADGFLGFGLSIGGSVSIIDDSSSFFGNAEAGDVVITNLGGDRFRVELDSESLSGAVEIQCVNPPTLDMLVAAMRGEG